MQEIKSITNRWTIANKKTGAKHLVVLTDVSQQDDEYQIFYLVLVNLESRRTHGIEFICYVEDNPWEQMRHQIGVCYREMYRWAPRERVKRYPIRNIYGREVIETLSQHPWKAQWSLDDSGLPVAEWTLDLKPTKVRYSRRHNSAVLRESRGGRIRR